MSLHPHAIQDEHLLRRLERIVGPGNVSSGDPVRMAYARDMWPRCLIQQRSGLFEHPPAVVVWPADTRQVAAVVRLAADTATALVPFGAGSGVCGGTLPVRGGIVCDLKRLDRIVGLCERDHVLEVETGVIGENLERELNRRGWTLGHFPSSIYCSTVGGWLAGRSAGQCSSRYGKIEDMCRSITWVDATGSIQRTPFTPPGHSTWSIDPLLLGSEGTLGVLTRAELIVRRLPPARWFRAYKLPDVEAGISTMRQLLRVGLRPSVLRLYDEFDTLIAKTGSTSDLPEEQITTGLLGELGATLKGPMRALFARSLHGVLQMPRLLNRVTGMLPGGCLLVVVFEGEPDDLEPVAQLTRSVCLRHAASDLGEDPARHWWEHRYSVSYKQSAIFAANAFVDTMEVAATWDRLPRLYQAVRRALAKLAFVMAHFSHAYREGGSIYFTFAAAAADDASAAALYDRIWNAAQAAVLAEGATISHHHGVGLSKAAFLVRQLGAATVLAGAVKNAFDPTGLFNPGKLGQPESGKGDA